MSTAALILMISVQGLVTVITAYFLLRVLRSPAEKDSEED